MVHAMDGKSGRAASTVSTAGGRSARCVPERTDDHGHSSTIHPEPSQVVGIAGQRPYGAKIFQAGGATELDTMDLHDRCVRTQRG